MKLNFRRCVPPSNHGAMRIKLHLKHGPFNARLTLPWETGAARLSICLSVSQSVSLFVSLSVIFLTLSLCLSGIVNLSICLSLYHWVYLPLSLSICVSVCSSLYLPFYQNWKEQNCEQIINLVKTYQIWLAESKP